MAFALGTTQSTSNFGTVGAGWLLPWLYTVDGFLGIKQGLFLPLLAVTAICTLSWLCSMVLNWIDKITDR